MQNNFLLPILTSIIWRARGWKWGNYKMIPLYSLIYFAYASAIGFERYWWIILAGILTSIIEQNMNLQGEFPDGFNSFKSYTWSTSVGVFLGIAPLIAMPYSNAIIWIVSGAFSGLGLLLWRLSQKNQWFKSWWISEGYDSEQPFLEENGYGELLAGLLMGIGLWLTLFFIQKG